MLPCTILIGSPCPKQMGLRRKPGFKGIQRVRIKYHMKRRSDQEESRRALSYFSNFQISFPQHIRDKCWDSPWMVSIRGLVDSYYCLQKHNEEKTITQCRSVPAHEEFHSSLGPLESPHRSLALMIPCCAWSSQKEKCGTAQHWVLFQNLEGTGFHTSVAHTCHFCP